MAKNYLTLEDLNAFFQTRNRAMHFSAKDDNDEIVVSLKATISFEETENDATEGLTPVRLKACHTLDNANHTYIPREDMTTALPSFANRPILAYIYKDSNGDYQFKSHEKHIDEDGELVYDEVPVGVIRENCNAHLEYDEEAQKEYVVVQGTLASSLILKDYKRVKQCFLNLNPSFTKVINNN